MRQQLADGDSVLVAAAKGGNVVHDGVVQPNLLLVEEDHDGRRGADDLGQRSDVVDGPLRINRGAGLAPGEPTESFLENRRALPADYD